MMFVYKQWDKFCKELKNHGFVGVSASTVMQAKQGEKFLILKHDVETNPMKALKLAQIENKYSHKGSYYVQAYLLNKEKNIHILKQIQKLGHEVSYHHDVMDSNKGNLTKAKEEFQRNIKKFEENGFYIETVCQHGNPVVERKGYYSNRDFFRKDEIAQFFGNITEIMVNFKSNSNKNYKYISDAGYGWKIIYDPENNDIIDSSKKDIILGNLDKVFNIINTQDNVVVSTHPHRWNSNRINAEFKNVIFRVVKFIAKIFLKIPFMKKLMEKFYYLAKKI